MRPAPPDPRGLMSGYNAVVSNDKSAVCVGRKCGRFVYSE